jgi:GNAT superfamily N-acetyltransferase
MAGVSGAWVLRPLRGVADHALVEELWLAALEGRWPLLPRAIAMVRDGFFAVEGGRPAGFVAVDLAGSIPLVLVAPGYQRCGIGAGLLSAALGRLAAAGVSTARARTPSTGRCSARRPPQSAASGSHPIWRDAASALPWWHARPRYCATAVPAPATSAGPSASISTPGPGTGPGAATACSARPPVLARPRSFLGASRKERSSERRWNGHCR